MNLMSGGARILKCGAEGAARDARASLLPRCATSPFLFFYSPFFIFLFFLFFIFLFLILHFYFFYFWFIFYLFLLFFLFFYIFYFYFIGFYCNPMRIHSLLFKNLIGSIAFY